ncbi:MAG TPA: VOC family protein [Thermomicrobiales bacterium]|nr:VOC family protein [Thermomicrobiales bacterium]
MQSVIPAFAVADIEASLKFYADALGFAETFRLPGDDGRLVHASVQRGDVSLMFGAIDRIPELADRPPLGRGVVLYTTVGEDEDIDALYARAVANGATVLEPPADQPWGHRDWTIADPDGYAITVSKVTRAISPDDVREALAAPAD